jgi:hypothetical protein
LITHLEHVEDRRDECLLIQKSVRTVFYTIRTVKNFSLIPIEAKPFGIKTNEATQDYDLFLDIHLKERFLLCNRNWQGQKTITSKGAKRQ